MLVEPRRRAPARRRLFHAAAFQPSPELEGLHLASPSRRLGAFAIDVLLVFIPSIAVAVAASVAAMAVREPAAFEAVRTLVAGTPDDDGRTRLLGQIAPLLVRGDATGVPPAVALAVQEGDLARAGQILSAYDFTFAVGDGSPTLRPDTIRVHMDRFIPDPLRNITLLAVAAAYFTFFTAASRRTPGKRLMRTRVVTLHGRPLTVYQSFERFGGYFASLGTFGLGLRDLWHEPNSRLAHDRLADTVVVGSAPAEDGARTIDAPMADE